MNICNENIIRIGILGLKNSGKSTLVNAWVRSIVTEAAEEDCTKSNHNFKLSIEENPEDGRKAREDILQRITAMNASSARDAEEDFDLPLPGHLIIPGQDNLSFVITDFPCVDQSPDLIGRIYRDRFDLVIVLLDNTGAMTDEFKKQKRLLMDIKETMDGLKVYDRPPLVIGINKVDDPSDTETKKRLLKEISCVEEVFGVEDRVANLTALLSDANSDHIKLDDESFPIVVPFSAKNAFFFRQFECVDFDRFNEEEIGKLAKEIFGYRVLESCSPDDLRQKTSDSYKEVCPNLLKGTGFHNFEHAVKVCLEGKKRQGYILAEQLRRDVSSSEDVDVQGGYTMDFIENVTQQRKFSDVIQQGPNFENYKMLFAKHLMANHFYPKQMSPKHPDCYIHYSH